MKQRLLMAVVAVVLFSLTIAMVVSCKKQIPATPENETNYAQMQEEDFLFLHKVKTFKQKIEYLKNNPDIRSAEDMEQDSTVWYLQALMNYTYSYTDKKYGNTYTDSADIFIPLNNDNRANMSDVNTGYSVLIDSVRNIYFECGFNDKELIIVNLKKISINNNQLQIRAFAIIGQLRGAIYYGDPFEEEDDWKYGFYLGHCDYTNPGSDAAEELEAEINANRWPPLFLEEGYRFVYTPDDDPIFLYGNEYRTPSDILDNYLDYLMFYCTTEVNSIEEDVEECVEDVEMNFYYNGECEVIYEVIPYLPDSPPRYWVISLDIQGFHESYPIAGTTHERIFHKNTLTFGTWIIVYSGDMDHIHVDY